MRYLINLIVDDRFDDFFRWLSFLATSFIRSGLNRFDVSRSSSFCQGSKDVVEFLVMNSTVIDVEGKRDTKKV